MSTVIRATIVPSNPYYISKHRYYELKHHCLQYDEWKLALVKEANQSLESEETDRIATNLAFYGSAIEQINRCCEEAGGDISQWLLIAVTKGKSYAVLVPPCSKEYFYQRYRKFFYLLDQLR